MQAVSGASPMKEIIEKLEQEITQRQQTLEVCTQELAQLQASLDQLRHVESPAGRMSRTLPVPVRSLEYRGLRIVEAAARYLAEVGEPRPTEEIARVLLERGLITRSTNFRSTVYAVLQHEEKQHGTFVRVAPRAWGLAPTPAGPPGEPPSA